MWRRRARDTRAPPFFLLRKLLFSCPSLLWAPWEGAACNPTKRGNKLLSFMCELPDKFNVTFSGLHVELCSCWRLPHHSSSWESYCSVALLFFGHLEKELPATLREEVTSCYERLVFWVCGCGKAAADVVLFTVFLINANIPALISSRERRYDDGVRC